MKVCHVITGLDLGGAELALCGLLESLGEPEHMVVALGGRSVLSRRVGKLAELHHLDMTAGRAGFTDLLRLRRLLAARGNRPNVVHAWMYHANLMAALAATGLGIPLIWDIHHSLSDLASEKRGTRAVIRANALLSRVPARIRYVSATAAEQHRLAGFAQKRAIVIPNGYDVELFKPDPNARARVRSELEIPPDSLVIGMVARVHPTKDHANFLRAAERFRMGNPDTIFVLIGEGTDRDPDLLRRVQSLGLQAHVRLCGMRHDVAALNAAFDIATLSSRGEAFPNAIAEAMACGVPCVSTDVGDAGMIIGDTGMTVAPRNPLALSEGWSRLASLTAGERRELGAHARQRIIGNFGRATISKRYDWLYHELAPGQPPLNAAAS